MALFAKHHNHIHIMSTVRTVDAADEKRLAELGYKQELKRSWGLLQVCVA